eukprot:TRINITY_DN6002_c0_g1_i1.p1 TRINITY_DN6002_c0_g1~~TRINITY_DN6002_c0_g1_i1.p1  ORF type:complete len:1300 (-),score=349.43 TRINITY_DN6002_c0_g1_i1:26-3889(-)
MSSGEASSRPRRLMIKRMVLDNFKSYAGVQEVGPFHKSFSAVVGPNGSGKSNVIDAMLFVFGKRAKEIRLNKVGELIHNSDSHRDLQEAKVSVYFQEIYDDDESRDGHDHYEVIPGTEFVVTRTARKDNSSKYYINGKGSNFTEVTTMLRAKGIDLDHNRFLILQGEVEQIAMMKPKAATPHEEGLLEYLEDIIGSNKYVEDIENAAKRVEELNEARGEKLNRVKVVEKDKENLESAKLEAEESLRKEREAIEARSTLYQKYRRQASAKVESMTAQQTGLEEKLSAEKDKMKESADKLDEMETGIKRTQKELEKVTTEMEAAKTEFSVFERKDVKFREDLKHLKAQHKKQETSIKAEEKKVRELESALTANTADLEKYEGKVTDLQESLKREEVGLEKLYAKAKVETQSLHEELSKKQQALIPWSKQLTETQATVSVQKEELDLLNSRAAAARSSLEQAKQALEETETLIKSRKGDIDRAKKDLDASRSKLSDLQKSEAELGRKEEGLLQERREYLSKIEELRHATSSVQSRGRVLDSLMTLKKKGQLPGVHGRLGDLGAIDVWYDVAVSTACSALDNVVVDTTETAQKCVEHLRKNNLGRMTFVILDQIEHLRGSATSKIAVPEGAQRLFDLVKMKNADQYATAFYFAMRDTLVAKDLESATSIAYGAKRWRVVTLEGQLIDMSGTMAGGGTQVARGLMGSKIVDKDQEQQQRDLQEAEKRVEQVTKEQQENRTRRSALEQELLQTQQNINQLEISIPKMEMDVKALPVKQKELQASIPVLERNFKEATAASGNEGDRVRELEASIKAGEDEIKKIRKTFDKLEKEVQDVQQHILDAGGIELKAQKSKVETIASQISEAKSMITKTKVQIKTGTQKIQKTNADKEKAEKELVNLDKKLEETRAEFQQLEAGAKEVLETYNKSNDLVGEKNEELKAARVEYDQLKKIVDKARGVEIDIQNKLEECLASIKESEEKAQHWQRKFEELDRKYVALLKVQEDAERLDPEEGAPANTSQGASSSSSSSALPASLPVLTDEELDNHDKDDLSRTIAELESDLAKMKPNMLAIKEYRRKEAEYRTRVAELDQVTNDRDEERKRWEGLRKRRLDEFMAAFSVITMKLKEMYQMITLGGDAELELVDSLDPFSEGIIFSVRPPKKSWKNIINLSGGEKTLSSLALVFALHHYKPTPLYVMDEIDAALDFKNVSIVANYIKERTQNAQFIIISLRNYMFELADRLVGIYKTHNATKSVTVNPKTFAQAFDGSGASSTEPVDSTAEDSPSSSASMSK